MHAVIFIHLIGRYRPRGAAGATAVLVHKSIDLAVERPGLGNRCAASKSSRDVFRNLADESSSNRPMIANTRRPR
jgi:hypothetical protein